MIVLKEFFVNFCILCTGIFFIHLYFFKYKVTQTSPGHRKILAGVLQGFFGVLLLTFGVHIPGGIIMDLRIVPIMIAIQVGGPAAGLVATVIIVVARILLYPLTFSSYLNMVVIVIAFLTFILANKTPIKRNQKWTVMTLTYLLLMGCSLPLLIPDTKAAIMLYVQYAFAIICATGMTQVLTTYLWRSHEQFEKLKEQAQKDHLTGLNNTRTFNTTLNHSYRKAVQHNEGLALLMIDVDHFKHINDTYGHPTGDEVLKQISEIFVQSCRSIDIVSRNGGEEFSVIMPACDDNAAKKVAQRIRQAVEQHTFVIHESLCLNITVSIGYSIVQGKYPLSIPELIQQADQGLYTAKQNGRNRVHCLAAF